MPKDKDRELKRLEEQLLAEEQTGDEMDDLPFEVFDDTAPADVQVPYRNFANGYRAYTNQPSDVDLESYSEEVRTGQPKSNQPLIITALLLLTGILAVLCWWAVRYLGVLG